MTGSLITLPDGSSFSIIKPLIGFKSKIEQQLRRFPYDKNVFLMMRFRDANKELSDFIIDTLKSAGLNGVRADQPEWDLTKNVYNLVAVLYCCKYGIALFDEAETNQAYNPNVLYELGMMHSLDRDCLILRNDSLPTVPFDLIKDLSKVYKGELAVKQIVQRWLQSLALYVPETRSPSAADGESRLESAAVSAPIDIDETNEVIASPDGIATAEFGWRVLAKTKKKWSVSWDIKLTNNRPRSATVKVQVLFLDEDGFALEDHTGSPTSIAPSKTVKHRETLSMSPDLAERVRRAMATVSQIGRTRRESNPRRTRKSKTS